MRTFFPGTRREENIAYETRVEREALCRDIGAKLFRHVGVYGLEAMTTTATMASQKMVQSERNGYTEESRRCRQREGRGDEGYQVRWYNRGYAAGVVSWSCLRGELT